MIKCLFTVHRWLCVVGARGVGRVDPRALGVTCSLGEMVEELLVGSAAGGREAPGCVPSPAPKSL